MHQFRWPPQSPRILTETLAQTAICLYTFVPVNHHSRLQTTTRVKRLVVKVDVHCHNNILDKSFKQHLNTLTFLLLGSVQQIALISRYGMERKILSCEQIATFPPSPPSASLCANKEIQCYFLVQIDQTTQRNGYHK